jgi:hypothetical protein
LATKDSFFQGKTGKLLVTSKDYWRIFNMKTISSVVIAVALLFGVMFGTSSIAKADEQPSDDVIKSAVILRTGLDSNKIDEVKIANKYTRKKDDEVFYIYDYLVSYNMGGTVKVISWKRGDVGLVKRWNKWQFYQVDKVFKDN